MTTSVGRGRARTLGASAALIALLQGCGGARSGSIPIQTGAPCAYCRMTLVDPKLAAEIVAPGEEPRFYDDIGCLANDLRRGAPPAGARAYVADHVTGTLVEAVTARYTRVESLETPMGSHVIAHADAASRGADATVQGRRVLDAEAVFGPNRLPGERHAR